MKLNRIDASFLVQVLIIKLLENFQKMTGFLKSFCPSISKSLHIDFNASQMFLFSYCLMVWFPLNSKFRFDWCHGKMIDDTDSKLI